MDPLAFFLSDVSECILQHLEVSEILANTEVSRTWEEVIGSSFIAMKKLEIKITHKSSPNQAPELVESQRKYQHLVLQSPSFSIDDIIDIMSAPQRVWKSIHLENIHFESPIIFYEFMSTIEATVEEIFMKEVSIKFEPELDLDDIDYLNFPNLKDLTLELSSIHKVFRSCRSLTSLDVNYWDSEASGTVKHLMANNDHLEYLKVTTNQLVPLFNEYVVPHNRLQLKTFIAKDWPWIIRSQLNEDCFNKFLESQKNSLTTLILEKWMGVNVLKCIFSMPKIQTLVIKRFDKAELTIDWKFVKLNCSRSIRSLSFDDRKNSFDILKALIDGAPNIKTLEIFSVTQKNMEYISAKAPNLSSLTLSTIEATDFTSPNLFPKIEEVVIDLVHESIETIMMGILKQNRNEFVRLFLEADYSIIH